MSITTTWDEDSQTLVYGNSDLPENVDRTLGGKVKWTKRSNVNFAESNKATLPLRILEELCNKTERSETMSQIGSNWGQYEAACNEVEKNATTSTGDVREWAINGLMREAVCTVYYPKGRMNTKIRRLAEQYPDEVKICADNDDGSIVAHIPKSAVKISIRKGRQMTEEQKEAARQRILEYHKRRAEGNSDIDDELEALEDELDEEMDSDNSAEEDE